MKRKERNIKVGWQRKGKDERGNESERKIKEESRKRQGGEDNFNDGLLCVSSCHRYFNPYGSIPFHTTKLNLVGG